jgi:hypothetical protein
MDLGPVLPRERPGGEHILGHLPEEGGCLGDAPFQLGTHLLQVPAGTLLIGLGDDRPHQPHPPRLAVPRETVEQSPHHMDPAPLRARPAEHLAEGPAEPLRGIGDDQVDSAQAPADEAPEKVQPEFVRLARPHVDAQDLTVPLFSAAVRFCTRING